MVPRLRQHGFDIEVFSDQQCEGVQHYLTAGYEHSRKPFDLFFHQVESGVAAHFLRTAVGLFPGIVFFHDLYLPDLGPDPLTNSPWSFVADLLKTNPEGSIDWPSRTQEFPRVGPFPEREFALAWGSIFSNPRFHQDAINHRLSAAMKKSFFIPMPIQVPTLESTGSNTDTSEHANIVIFGNPFAEDRVQKSLLAIKKISNTRPISTTWAVHPTHVSIAKAQVALLGVPSVQVIPVQSLADWTAVASTATVCMHLHYSVFGSLSPFIETSLALEKPVLISDLIDNRYYPEGAVWTIPPGGNETQYIEHTLASILETPALQQNQIGKNFVTANNDPTLIVHEFVSMFTACVSSTLFTSLSTRWSSVRHAAHQDLLKDQATHGVGSNVDSNFTLQAVYDELDWS